MRSWKTPALLATVGLCGLGSLFAQGPYLPSPAEPVMVESPSIPMPTPADSSTTVIPSDSSPALPVRHEYVPAPDSYSSGVIMESAPIEPSSVSLGATVDGPGPACCDNVAVNATPVVESSFVESAPVIVHSAPVMSQPSCGCQGTGGAAVSSYLHGSSSGAHIGSGPSPSYLMGSGSGVGSGLLSPNANSGGLHTRYPYYNYRHSWYYQGPPSQNVTIIW